MFFQDLNVTMLIICLFNLAKGTQFRALESFTEHHRATLCSYHTSNTVLMKNFISPAMLSTSGKTDVEKTTRLIRPAHSFLVSNSSVFMQFSPL